MTLSGILQLSADGLINGSQYALYGVGFGLILGVTGRFHYAYALVFTVCGYVVSLLQSSAGGPFPLLAAAGLAAAVLTGVSCEAGIYRPLARRSGQLSLLTVFVAALGVTIAGVNLIVLLFGEQSRTMSNRASHVNHLAGISFTTLEAGSVVTAWVLIGALAAVLRFTQFGRMVRAVRVNPDMAAVVGVGIERIYLWVFAIGSLLTGAGAIVYGLRFAVTPDMGTVPVVFAFVVAFLGGTRSSPLVVGLAGLLLGLVQSLSGIWLSSQWSALVVFTVLFGYLCLKPASLRLLVSPLRGPQPARQAGAE